MSFDKDTRNLLTRTVTACRRRLTEDVTDQLRGVYGLHPDGTVLPLDKLTHLSPDQTAAARRLRDLLEHYTAGAAGKDQERRTAAYERMVLEISFTFLNRFAALRLCEERGLVVECVRRGTASDGFQLFERVSGGALGARYDAYRVFIECLFDELALDLGVLFDRLTPQSSVFPTQRCMEDVLAELNKSELTSLWTEDETIGWIYQYFNPPEERKAMREASQAPRNSRELAVRNQFFTPRYVVEFLTDNSLARIWSEMRKGDTALKEECHYLVRRPNEVFLAPGETGPADQEGGPDLSQEELLRKPVYIANRPKKDPRDLRVLDPACGSGHFLLYAFDLLERIYEEAWQDADSPKSEVSGHALKEEFETLDDLRRAAPKLIIEHNLHGIDIDPRAVQIAALALWLRAQKAWANLRLKAVDRPRIDRSNIVTAEPMPGDEDLRREFTAALKPRVLGQLVEVVFEKMKLAGEIGPLLKIEEEIKNAVAEARMQWLDIPKLEQQFLFPGIADPGPKQTEFRFDLAGVTEETFWAQAEDRILEALKDYAEQAENGFAIRRRLFAEDAARGFAFIDLCRKRYDVALMNPPFGETVPATRNYIAKHFPEAKDDIYSTFVARFVRKLDDGFVGVISNRTGLFLAGMRRWREQILIGSSGLRFLADLGDGVLDDALVEAAAYVIGKSPGSSVYFRLLDDADKQHPLLISINDLRHAKLRHGTFLCWNAAFGDFPQTRISYWAPLSVRKIYKTFSGADGSGLEVKFGLSTKDDFRFVRTYWEISPARLVLHQDNAKMDQPWMYLAKGGEYAVHYCDIHLVVNWAYRGREIAAKVIQQYPYLNGNANWVLHTEVPYGRSGITYTKRTTSGFSPRFLPSGCLISDLGCTIFVDDEVKLPQVLATYASRAFGYLLEFNVASGDSVRSGSAARHYEIGTVAAVPIPQITDIRTEAAINGVSIWQRKARRDGYDETKRFFAHARLSVSPSMTLSKSAAALRDEDLTECVQNLSEASEMEDEVRRCYKFGSEAVDACEAEFGPDVNKYPKTLSQNGLTLLPKLWADSISQVIAGTSEVLGFRRYISKMTHIANRRLELLCHRLGSHPETIAQALRTLPATAEETAQLTQDVISYAIGCVYGRWDVRIAQDASLVPKLPTPFDPLPVCPPGMLVGPDGLPAERHRIASEQWLRGRPDAGRPPPEGSVKNAILPHDGYPLRVSWDAILVDDPGTTGRLLHRDDIVGRVREVLDLLWNDKAHDIEQEACAILGVSDLRDYFRRPSGFFQDHLKRYSKSRRKAPIYWPLSTKSGSYTVWLYYHRLSDQTLYAAVNTYVEPKIAEIERELARIEEEFKAASGREATRLTDRLNEVRTLLSELQEMREEILRIASLPYKPNLNDGVIINASPFHNVFRLRPWAKNTGDCWKKLRKGDYDWAHLAYTIWPERVREVCRKDRSIAIAHGLEDLCELTTQTSNSSGRRRSRKQEAAE